MHLECFKDCWDKSPHNDDGKITFSTRAAAIPGKLEHEIRVALFWVPFSGPKNATQKVKANCWPSLFASRFWVRKMAPILGLLFGRCFKKI